MTKRRKPRKSKPIKRTLVIEVDVTGWTDHQIQSLDLSMCAQLEAPDDGAYPGAENAISRIIDQKPYRGSIACMTTFLSGDPDVDDLVTDIAMTPGRP